MSFLLAVVLAVLMPATALAAAPSASLTLLSYGPPSLAFGGTCGIEIYLQWTGFKNAAYDEVYVYDETLHIAYGIGYDGSGNKLASPIFPGQNADAMGTAVYFGHTIELHADLLSKNGTVISKTVTSLPTFTVNSNCVM
jgi:hypothetical protein